jgi:hypothetical protein
MAVTFFQREVFLFQEGRTRALLAMGVSPLMAKVIISRKR